MKRLKVCASPGCPNLTSAWLCASCLGDKRRKQDAVRGSSASRGYGKAWAENSKRFLKSNPWCVDCGGRATVADHDPIKRRDLLAQGVADPDAWHRLKPRCGECDKRRRANEEMVRDRGRFAG